jgi:16S rRNA (cytosine967-C5)-methyltransferase
MMRWEHRQVNVTAGDSWSFAALPRRLAGVTSYTEKLAARIIATVREGTAADQALRDGLRAERGLSPETLREVSRSVFAWCRWFRWLETHAPVGTQVAMARSLARLFAKEPQTFSDEDLQRAVPEWVSGVMDVPPGWLRTLQAEPPLWIRARRAVAETLKMTWRRDLRSPLKALPEAMVFSGERDLFQTEEFRRGDFEIQDVASQAVGLVCGARRGETWWDACAGEGGKTLHLSDLMENSGLIWASDRAQWRLAKLKKRAARAGCFNYRTVVWDGGEKPPTPTKFDGVLVDAPCSGIGTWQRNPHARWSTTPKDVTELAEIQSRLLATAAGSVKPGGKLIYAVCTLSHAETTGVTAAFERSHPEFQPLGTPDPLTAGQPVRVIHLWWPHLHHGNGMFVATWQRAK